MPNKRTESDSIGSMQIPADAYYGVQTYRGYLNFHITGIPLSSVFIRNIVKIKKAAALTNVKAGLLDEKTGQAIVAACDEALAGKLDSGFITDSIQGGAGTTANMNVNEVIANRATELLGGKKGEYLCHPNDHVNCSQSTNDVIPTAGRLTVIELAARLDESVAKLVSALDEKAAEFDGIVKMGLGLGKLVVDGGQVLRFSPRYPKKVLQLSTPELALRETQRYMYALNLRPEAFKTSIDDAINLEKFDINAARNFRNRDYAASTWDMQSQRISDSNDGDGRKIITFSHILKYDTFPLPEIVCDLLEMGQNEMRCPVELEFAVNLDVHSGQQKIFNFLQIRPIIETEKNRTIDWSGVDVSDALIYAESALGVGAMPGIRDIIYVKLPDFDPRKTEQIAEELSRFNAEMRNEKTGYVLVGPGRWGSSDPWLGIPVRWNHISEAKVIVECGLENFRVEPSQGTHFFQNLTSLGVGYMTINPFMNDGTFDIETLDAMPAFQEGTFLRRVRFDEPLYVFIDGQNNKGIVKK